jgi:hypothetical protein
MDPMQFQMIDALPGEKWSPVREVFHFDGLGEGSMLRDEKSAVEAVS